MRKFRWVLAVAALAAMPAALFAQQAGGVSGRVTDQATGRPLAGAQVQVQGTVRRSVTNAQGQYRITDIPAGTYAVSVSMLGTSGATRRVSIGAGQTATADFVLAQTAVELQAVVVNAVTGQAQRRVEAGTNIGTVNVARLNKGPITQATDVLQGRIAGVNLQGATGTVGSGQRIRIRGANSLSLSNDPLLYIDGVLASTSRGGIALGGQDYSRLNDINPEDIENIEVLKGPAASALYGTAAANGVVLVTTRRGRAGATRFRGFAEAGRIRDIAPYPANYAALTAFDTTQPYYDIPSGGILNVRTIFGRSAGYDICPNYRAAIPTGTTLFGQTPCRQDRMLSFNQLRDPRTTPYETGGSSKLGLSAAGGSERLTYYISGDRERQEGVLQPNTLERINLRSNLTAGLSENADVSINANYVTTSTNRISSDNSIFSPLINGLLGTAQYLPGMESDTVLTAGSRLGSYFGYNTADQRKVQADQNVDRFIVGANTNYRPLSWLALNANVGLDFFSRFDRRTINPNELPLAQVYILGFRDAYRANNYVWTGNTSATATWGVTSDLTSTSTLGGSFVRENFDQVNCFGAGIPAGTRSCAATTSLFSVDESYSDARTLGLFAREQLAFGDRLFVAGSIRADNNSGLVSGLTYYPSANVSWVVSREGFFPSTSFLSQLRLRAAAGQSGLRPAFGQGETFFSSAVVQANATNAPGLVLTNTGNPNLRAERTREYEAGFDLGLFGERVAAEYTYYNKRSKDALIARPLPPSAGLTASVFENLGSVRNSGNELGLNARIVERERVRFSARLTATTLSNRLETLGQGIPPIVFNRGAQAHREGFPLGAFFATPITYNDADGNGKLSRAEVKVDSSQLLVVPSTRNLAGITLDTLNVAYVGASLPTNTQGLSAELTLFKNLTFSTLFERRAGNKQLNYTEFFRCRTTNANPYFSQCGALSDTTASLQAQAAFIGAQFLGATPYGYIEDASFIKWREFSVRLGIPEAVSSRLPALRGAAVSFSGRNLKTWTNYTGLDPEINEGGGGANFTQNEFNTQPPVRVFNIRMDFNI